MATVVIQKRTGKNGTRSYGVYYKDPLTGERRYYKTFHRDKDARRAENKLRSLIDNGELAEIRKSQSRIRLMRYSEVAKSLRLEWKTEKELADKTLEDYGYWLDVTERIFGDRLACEIPDTDIKDYRKKVADDFSKVTANRHLFVIKQVFKHGMGIKAVFEDPAAKISYYSEKDQERKQFLLPNKLDELLEASRKTKAKYLPALICLGAEHGASKQEALDLTLDDVDFDFMEKGMIHFYRTKTKLDRTEFLMPRSKRELQAYLAHRDWMRKRKGVSANGSRLVFAHLDGSPLKRFNKAWRETCRLAGINDSHFHDLRHTFCSNARLAGADLKDVRDMIGHSDISMTDRYTHLPHPRKEACQANLARHYANGMTSGEDGGKIEAKIAEFRKKRESR
jgi:integrase